MHYVYVLKKNREFSAEFKNEDLFPYHQPKNCSSPNIVMASFSYARHYYPEVKPDVLINLVELCKRTQNEIFRRKGKDSVIDKKQIKDFYESVEALPKKQKNIIRSSMPSYPLFRGKGKMIGKTIRYRGRQAVTSIARDFHEKIRHKIKVISLRLINRPHCLTHL